MSGERDEMQRRAYRLCDEGRMYFRCNNARGCDIGPTVVDEDGCCVYCGMGAELVPPGGGATTRGERDVTAREVIRESAMHFESLVGPSEEVTALYRARAAALRVIADRIESEMEHPVHAPGRNAGSGT